MSVFDQRGQTVGNQSNTHIDDIKRILVEANIDYVYEQNQFGRQFLNYERSSAFVSFIFDERGTLIDVAGWDY